MSFKNVWKKGIKFIIKKLVNNEKLKEYLAGKEFKEGRDLLKEFFDDTHPNLNNEIDLTHFLDNEMFKRALKQFRINIVDFQSKNTNSEKFGLIKDELKKKIIFIIKLLPQETIDILKNEFDGYDDEKTTTEEAKTIEGKKTNEGKKKIRFLIEAIIEAEEEKAEEEKAEEEKKKGKSQQNYDTINYIEKSQIERLVCIMIREEIKKTIKKDRGEIQKKMSEKWAEKYTQDV